jgi:hypothetical protein
MSEDADNAAFESSGKSQVSNRRAFLTDAIAVGGLAAGLGVPSSLIASEPAQGGRPVNPRLFTFVGGRSGGWSVVSAETIIGDPLPVVERVEIVAGAVSTPTAGEKWILRGVTSNERYVTRDEKTTLAQKQAALGRLTSDHAALIPIRKNAAWWALTQDERRELFEEKSRHIAIGLKYLPEIARRLHHCRDLSESEPFDFLTLFDYSQEHAAAFDDLVAALRGTEEWKFVDREVDLRLVKVT